MSGVEKNRTKIGRLFEKLFAKRYEGIKPIPNSGAGPFFKMDAESRQIVWSLKATGNNSYRLTKDDLHEVSNAVVGPGGAGSFFIPAMAISFVEGDEPENSDQVYAVLPMDDFVSLVTNQTVLFEPSKEDVKVKQGETPGLFR